jgi:hypothetical protein
MFILAVQELDDLIPTCLLDERITAFAREWAVDWHA